MVTSKISFRKGDRTFFPSINNKGSLHLVELQLAMCYRNLCRKLIQQMQNHAKSIEAQKKKEKIQFLEQTKNHIQRSQKQFQYLQAAFKALKLK